MRVRVSTTQKPGSSTASRDRNGNKNWQEITHEALQAQYVQLLQAQAELEESRARYAELYDGAPVGFLTLSRAGFIKEINLTGAQFLGFSRQVIKRYPLVFFVAPRDRKKFLRFMSHMRRTPGRGNVELEVKGRNYETAFVDLIAIPSVALSSWPQHFECALVDITARHRAESELRESEQKFRTLARHAPVGIGLFDAAGGNILVNDAWCQMTDFPADRLEGKRWLNAVHPDDREQVSSAWHAVRHVGSASPVEFRLLRPDGEILWVQGSAVQLKDATGQYTGFIATMADITQRKQAESATQRLAAIVEFSYDAIIGMDLNGIITSWNKGASEMYGYTAAEAIGQPVTMLIPGERQIEETEILKHIRQDQFIDRYETVRRRKDGALIEVSLTVSPIKDAAGRVVSVSKIARDITQTKRVEAELKHAHAEALAASRAKDDFLAALSHELRTPLNPVLLLASEAACDADLPPRARMDFDTIRKNIELEARLIDDMLDITRISHGKLRLERRPVDVRAILREAISTVQGEVEHKQIELTLETQGRNRSVLGDPVRLQQVFWNVLRNAVKFTPDKGKISVHVETTGAHLAVKVSDTGIGMSAQEIGQLFKAFSQGSHSGYGGLGLGLAISHKLIELHHGSIRASSDGPGRGATFVIELPVTGTTKVATAEKQPSPQLALPLAEKPAQSSVRILLVEDHEPTRKALAHLLARRNYRVETASSLAEARALTGRRHFNLLISDLGLPDGNGCDLMKEFSRQNGAKGIALTGYGMEQDISRTRAAGFVAHLTKPVRIEPLDRAIHAALRA